MTIAITILAILVGALTLATVLLAIDTFQRRKADRQAASAAATLAARVDTIDATTYALNIDADALCKRAGQQRYINKGNIA